MYFISYFKNPDDASIRYGRLAFVLGLFLIVFMQGSRGLLETTEGRYAECARETVASGNLLEPMLNGNHHWTKPPLTYWAIAAGSALFGNTPWGARAYLIPAFLATFFAVGILEAALFAEAGLGVTALVFATAPMALAAANTVSTDALLMCAQAWTMVCFWLGVRTRRRFQINLMWLAIGLGVAIKGPVGLLPLAAIIPAQYLLRKRGDAPRSLITPEGISIFILTGISWYAYVIWRYPHVFSDWINVEIIGRLTYDAHHRTSSEFHKIFVNYIPIMLLGTGPWFIWLCWIKRRSLKLNNLKALLADNNYGVEYTFLFLAIITQFLIFSASTSRMPLYLAPLFVPFAVLVGHGLTLALKRQEIRPKTILRVALITALCLTMVKGAVASQETWKNMSDVAAMLQENDAIREDTPITALFRAPLNGLEYHLDRRIPTIYFELEGNPEDLKKMEANGAAILPKVVAVANADLLTVAGQGAAARQEVPADSLVLVRSKDLDEFGPYFKDFGLNLLTKSKHWALLRLDTPIVLDGIEAVEENEKD